VVDEVSLAAAEDLALDVLGRVAVGYEWTTDNKKYVADYKAKTKTYPSMYGAQTYDAVGLIDRCG